MTIVTRSLYLLENGQNNLKFQTGQGKLLGNKLMSLESQLKGL